MSNEILYLAWKENGGVDEKPINRELFYDVMDGIRKGFPDDNEISTIFCEKIIPEAEYIFVDKDRNKEMTAPFIQYKVNGETKVLEIIRYHKVIWALLDRYCQKD